MTQELLSQLKELDTVFQNRSTEVCELLSPINDDYSHLTEFRLHRDFVDGEGYDWKHGKYAQRFPQSFLTSTNDEIQEYVNKELERIEQEKKELNEKFRKEQEEKEYKTYLKLKEKFEKLKEQL